METNEQIKSALRKTLEDELEQFLVQVGELILPLFGGSAATSVLQSSGDQDALA